MTNYVIDTERGYTVRHRGEERHYTTREAALADLRAHKGAVMVSHVKREATA